MELNLNNITFIIVSFKSEDIIHNCLKSLPSESKKIVIENLANKDIRHSAEIAQKLFGQIIEQLQKEKLIRKIQTKVRQTFKVIEGNNGSST